MLRQRCVSTVAIRVPLHVVAAFTFVERVELILYVLLSPSTYTTFRARMDAVVNFMFSPEAY